MAVLVELMDSLPLGPAVVVGYDVGVTTASRSPARSPTGCGRSSSGTRSRRRPSCPRALDLRRRAEFWYQDFHQLELASRLLDGNPTGVRTYLEHFWSHWGNRPDAVVDEELVAAYSRPGAFTASLNWYRSGSSTLYGALAIAEGGSYPGTGGRPGEGDLGRP